MTQTSPTAEDDALQALREGLGDEFEILRKLGKGSVATVYLAKERGLDRLVAIKVLDPKKAQDETTRRRFEREAKASASLTHPKVVRVFRFGRLPDDTPYLVMRFVKGRTMEERLQAEGRLSVQLARQVLVDVASALSAAHAQGIVHRDVKPANVLWDEDNEEALLTDFGIAAILSTGGEDVTRLTKTGQMIGDPKYMSPEQLMDEDVTELADIYELGILGYEILTGDGPYEARSNTQWITAHLNSEPRDLAQVRPDVEPGIADLLKRCLNKNPKHRPSAADVVRALEGEWLLERPPTFDVTKTTDRTEVSKRHIPAIVGTAGAIGLGIIGVVEVLGDYLPDYTRLLAVNLMVWLIAGSAVVGWFHGEKGKQRAPTVEYLLLGTVVLLWMAVNVVVFTTQP